MQIQKTQRKVNKAIVGLLKAGKNDKMISWSLLSLED